MAIYKGALDHLHLKAICSYLPLGDTGPLALASVIRLRKNSTLSGCIVPLLAASFLARLALAISTNSCIAAPICFLGIWLMNRPDFTGDPEVRILGYGKEQTWKQIFT